MQGQKADAWHHIYTGVILVCFAFFLPKKYRKYATGIGLGLVADEFVHVFHLLGLMKPVDYWSWQSMLATAGAFIFMAYCGKAWTMKRLLSQKPEHV